ncbi:MAG: protein-tyrosine phosphatase [Woeseiaceae bacterium]|jgi:protein-tyrosine phosphatase|tara:strand:+ start:35546 stop:36016 length:471 start_codon:yes stop_codon:yes gene_type:complete
MKKVNILFVCLGNICRSPMAEGVLNSLIKEVKHDNYIEVDSAATHNYHSNAPPDKRACFVASSHGIDITKQRSRQITDDDFAKFDLIFSMDESIHKNLLRRSKRSDYKIKQLADYIKELDYSSIPDPYYGDLNDFENTFSLIKEAMNILLIDLINK